MRAEEAPADLVLMGYVKEPFGLAGRVKLHVYTQDRLALSRFDAWWMAPTGKVPAWKRVVPEELVSQGTNVIAKLPGMDDRDAAFGMKGWQIAIARADFPPIEDESFYWADLIGLAVTNREGVAMGNVTDLLDIGPHQVLRVMDGGARGETLIPFVAQYVDRVDVEGGEIVVDWGADY